MGILLWPWVRFLNCLRWWGERRQRSFLLLLAHATSLQMGGGASSPSLCTQGWLIHSPFIRASTTLLPRQSACLALPSAVASQGQSQLTHYDDPRASSPNCCRWWGVHLWMSVYVCVASPLHPHHMLLISIILWTNTFFLCCEFDSMVSMVILLLCFLKQERN